MAASLQVAHILENSHHVIDVTLNESHHWSWRGRRLAVVSDDASPRNLGILTSASALASSTIRLRGVETAAAAAKDRRWRGAVRAGLTVGGKALGADTAIRIKGAGDTLVLSPNRR